LVLVEAPAGGLTSLACTYAGGATARLIEDTLSPLVLGGDAFAAQAAHPKMRIATRNLGGDGITAMAISAVDMTLRNQRSACPPSPTSPWPKLSASMYTPSNSSTVGIESNSNDSPAMSPAHLWPKTWWAISHRE
jgi:hypothetical protein